MLTEQQLTSVLATERRIYAALSEVLELTGELSRQLKHLGERRIDAALRGQHRSELLFRQHLYALLRRSGGAFFRLPEAVPQL